MTFFLNPLQDFELQMEDAYLKFVKATQELSLFLWKEDQQPYDISSMIIPVDKNYRQQCL